MKSPPRLVGEAERTRAICAPSGDHMGEPPPLTVTFEARREGLPPSAPTT
jgi:hypothetical protein